MSISALYIKTAGHYINEASGNPIVHKKIFQMFVAYMKLEDTWGYGGTVSTIHGKGKKLLRNEKIVL